MKLLLTVGLLLNCNFLLCADAEEEKYNEHHPNYDTLCRFMDIRNIVVSAAAERGIDRESCLWGEDERPFCGTDQVKSGLAFQTSNSRSPSTVTPWGKCQTLESVCGGDDQDHIIIKLLERVSLDFTGSFNPATLRTQSPYRSYRCEQLNFTAATFKGANPGETEGKLEQNSFTGYEGYHNHLGLKGELVWGGNGMALTHAVKSVDGKKCAPMSLKGMVDWDSEGQRKEYLALLEVYKRSKVGEKEEKPTIVDSTTD